MSEPVPTIDVIAGLLARNKRLRLPENWATLTPVELGMDSLDTVELQLELESVCEVQLMEDSVTESPYASMTLGALAQAIDALRGQAAR